MNKFEQLIEYVINDEESKARELFHEIVVEKSRTIYESLMDDEDLGGDAADDLIDEVESEEESDINMEAEGDEEIDDEEIDIDMGDDLGDDMGDDLGDDHHDDVGGDEELEDRVMDLEDKLDELMAEFEELMGDEGGDMGDGDDFGDDEGGDAIEMDDTEEMEPMAEAISLKAAPKPVTSEQGDGKAGPVAFNSGAAGMAAKPVHPTGTEAQGRAAPTTKDLIGDFQNKAGASMKDQKAAPKPTTGQASGVNTRTPFPKG